MSNLIAMTFGNVEEAEQVRGELGKLEDQHIVSLDDSAIGKEVVNLKNQ